MSSSGANEFGKQFGSLLSEATDGRVSELRWFKTDWQRGGAATAYATVDAGLDRERECVVKFPVGPKEYRLLVGLSGDHGPTPMIAFHGTELGSFDLAWVVMERLPGEPLRVCENPPTKRTFGDVAEVASRFYAGVDAALGVKVRPTAWDWAKLVTESRDACKSNPIENAQHWNKVLHDVAKHLDDLVRVWELREINTWVHGDLHLHNVMRRPVDSPWHVNRGVDDVGDAGECVLIDFGELRAGHWIEDAVYMERVYWANPEVSRGVKFVPLFARARKAQGLDTSDDYARLAHVRRVLIASCAPAWMAREGHPAYLEAALAMIEKTLPLVV